MRWFAFDWRLVAVAACAVLGWCAIAEACNVPVFRFALERWRPDPYRVVLFHRGALSDAEREMIRPLEENQDKALANLAIETVDLEAEGEISEQIAADRALYEAIGKPPLPWLVVQYPAHLRVPKPAWAGPLSKEFVSTAIDSPLRQELARRLTDGQTAVWLLLESGQADKDEPAAALLEAELKRLEQELELPELTPAPEDALASAVPLKIAFSVLRVPRASPAESALVAMLIGSEPDLAERSDPMVFPVFGRGRALLALIGAGITAQNIQDAAAFLAGPCSCEVKEQNPGFDLLLHADWDELLSKGGLPLAALETRSAPPPSEPVLVPIPSGALPSAANAPENTVVLLSYPLSPWFNRKVWIGCGVVLGVLLLAAIVVSLSQSRGHDAHA
jgi:hypothetical protein